ncbi:MAG TPA: hypothetical protein V6D28_26355 [Leptolyngbyaceae cyanobacterium]
MISDSLTISKLSSPSSVRRTWPIYLFAGIAINATIWGLALFYLKMASPSYTSDFAISLPAASSAANVNLPGIGQASASSESPYQVTSQDPRENYKFLLTSREVLNAAAESLKIESSEFGQPRVTTIGNTTIMKVELAGETPEQAQSKTVALLNALQNKLNELRLKQSSQQDLILQQSLNSSQNKLKEAQKKLLDYKANSNLNSADQVSSLTTNIEDLRKQRAQIIGQERLANGRLQELSINLNLNAKQAGDAFILQTDPIVQKLLQDYTESNAVLIDLNNKFLPNHPAVIDRVSRRDAAQAALLRRASAIVGRSVSIAELTQLNLSNTEQGASAKADLSQQLVVAQAERQGLAAQARALDQQIAQLESRLKILTQKEATLVNLERDVRTAEAVFSSTLARLDLGKSTVSGAYPLIQLFSEPSLPGSSTSPKKIFVYVGAALASLFCSNGLFLLWLRQRQKRKPKQLEPTTGELVAALSVPKPEAADVNKNGKKPLATR